MKALAILGCTLSLALPSKGAEKDSQAPHREHFTLSGGGHTWKPTKAWSPARLQRPVGSARLIVNAGNISSISVETDEPEWTVESIDGRHLALIGEADGIAYFAGHEKLGAGQSRRQVRRLDCVTRKWFAPWVPPAANDIDGREQETFLAFVVNDQFAVLQTVRKSSVDQSAYRLTCFEVGADEPLWTKEFPVDGILNHFKPAVLAPARPDMHEDHVRSLNFFDGNRLLFCPGPSAPVRLIDLSDGSELWCIRRIWEFDRGYIGPSVHSYFISRFALDDCYDPDRDDSPEEPASRRKAKAREDYLAARRLFEERKLATIVAGPQSVVTTTTNGKQVLAFVAVSRTSRESPSGLPKDCIVYELSEQGAVIAMGAIPRMVKHDQIVVQPGALLWGCQRGAVVRLVPTDADRSIGFGFTDRQLNIDWYREPRRLSRDAASRSNAPEFPACSTRNYWFCVAGGGFTNRLDNKLQLPITVVDLSSSNYEEMLLTVHGAELGDLYITGLHADADTLSVVLRKTGNQNHERIEISFDLSEYFDERAEGN